MPKTRQGHYPTPEQLEHCVPPAQHHQILPSVRLLPHALQPDVPYVQPKVGVKVKMYFQNISKCISGARSWVMEGRKVSKKWNEVLKKENLESGF